jgi:predicted transcriptional regulator
MPNSTKFQGFISYAHKNREYCIAIKEKLESVIKSNTQDQINLWFDEDLLAGSNWRDEIQSKLTNSHFVLLFVSNDFFASDFIKREEFPTIIEGFRKKNKVVIPIQVVDISDYNALEGLGNIQFFKASMLGENGSFASKYDNDKGQSWQAKFSNELHSHLKKQLTHLAKNIGSALNHTTGNKISDLSGFAHIQGASQNNRIRKFITVKPSDNLTSAATKILTSNPPIRHLIVQENSELKGILTLRDIFKIELDFTNLNDSSDIRVLDNDFFNIKVDDKMTKNVINYDYKADIIEVVKRFAYKQGSKKISIGALPVMKEGKVIEVVSYTDILKEWVQIFDDKKVEQLKNLKAEDLMTQGIDTIIDTYTIENANYMILRTGRRTLTAINSSGIFAGMISDYRVFNEYFRGNTQETVKDFLKIKEDGLIEFNRSSTFTEMIEAFKIEKELTSLPVLDDKNVVGVVSYTDLLKKMIEI